MRRSYQLSTREMALVIYALGSCSFEGSAAYVLLAREGDHAAWRAAMALRDRLTEEHDDAQGVTITITGRRCEACGHVGPA